MRRVYVMSPDHLLRIIRRILLQWREGIVIGEHSIDIRYADDTQLISVKEHEFLVDDAIAFSEHLRLELH